MKRFKITYPINGEEVELHAELMDMKHRMYSLEKQQTDANPLLIEKQENGGWKLKSQDSWSLTNSEINRLGETLEREYHNQPHSNS